MQLRRRLHGVFWAIAVAGIASAGPTFAEEKSYTTSFIHLAPGVPGVLYEPRLIGSKASIAIFSMHSSADYLDHSSCSELSKRGYRVLCANNSSSKSQGSDEGNLDRTVAEIRIALDWLRKVPGVEKIVLFGHSGGATVQTAYQMIAEGGIAACQRSELIYKCSNDLAGLHPADGLVLADANWGISTMTLFSIDPAVVDETTGKVLEPSLDMYREENGFQQGGTQYSREFRRRFLAAEGQRNNAVLAKALARYDEIRAGHGRYNEDEPFVVPGAALYGFNNKMFTQDASLLFHTLGTWPLVHADGSITTGIVHSVRVPSKASNLSPSIRAAVKTTVRGYLNSYATRTTTTFGYDETSRISGVEWRSNYANAPGNVQGITVPLLTLGMTGGWEGMAAETIHNLSASKDKELAFIEGATHVYTPCKACERVPGQFGDTVKTTYDYIDRWLAKPGRFLDKAVS